MTYNPLITLLSPRGQKHYRDTPVKEFLETYTLDDTHLTKVDKQKIHAVKESIELYTRTPDVTNQISSTRSAIDFFEPLLRNKDHEEVVIALLNTKNYVIHYETVFKGSLSSCINHPRELMRIVVKYPTARFIIAHNHPSGDPEPSDADLQSTKRIAEIGELMGIALVDHIIVANNYSISLQEHGWVN